MGNHRPGRLTDCAGTEKTVLKSVFAPSPPMFRPAYPGRDPPRTVIRRSGHLPASLSARAGFRDRGTLGDELAQAELLDLTRRRGRQLVRQFHALGPLGLGGPGAGDRGTGRRADRRRPQGRRPGDRRARRLARAPRDHGHLIAAAQTQAERGSRRAASERRGLILHVVAGATVGGQEILIERRRTALRPAVLGKTSSMDTASAPGPPAGTPASGDALALRAPARLKLCSGEMPLVIPPGQARDLRGGDSPALVKGEGSGAVTPR